MSQELHYTSAPRGLTPGTRGFCTVARTSELSNVMAERLESLSGYRQVFPPHHPSESLNPLVYSHLRVGNTDQSILSRIGFAGLDYSDRANKYAHHLLVSASERARGGPAWLIAQPGVMDSQWVGEPCILPAGRVVPRGDLLPGICRTWQQMAGDAGWAGALALAFLDHPDRPAYLVYEPGLNLLPLFVEALALVPPERRWQVTFSTYYTGVQPGISCLWRGVLAHSPEAEQAVRMPGALVVDLTHACGVAPASPLAHQARTGEVQAAVEEEEFEEPIVPEIDFAEPFSHGHRDSYQLGTPPPLEHAGAPGLGKRGNRPPRLPGQRITADSTRTPGQTRILVGALSLLVLGAAGGLSFWFIRDRLRQTSKAGSEVANVNGKTNQDELDDQAKAADRPKEKNPPLKPESDANQVISGSKPNVPGGDAQDESAASTEPKTLAEGESHAKVITPIYIKSNLATAKDNEALIAEIGMSRFTNIELLGWSHSPEAGKPLVEPKRTGLKVDARFRLNSVDEFLGSFEIKDQALVWNADVIGKRLDKDASGKALRNLANCLLRIEKERENPLFVLLSSPFERKVKFDYMYVDSTGSFPKWAKKKAEIPSWDTDIIKIEMFYYEHPNKFSNMYGNQKVNLNDIVGQFSLFENDLNGSESRRLVRALEIVKEINIDKIEENVGVALSAGITRTDYDIQFAAVFRSSAWAELREKIQENPRLKELMEFSLNEPQSRKRMQAILLKYSNEVPDKKFCVPIPSEEEWNSKIKAIEVKKYEETKPLVKQVIKDLDWVDMHSIDFCLIKEFIDDEGKSVFIRVDTPTLGKKKNKCKHSAEFSNPLHFAFRGIQLFAWHHWVRTPMI